VFIRNAIDIVQRSQDRTSLTEVVLTYPLLESMRWKLGTGLLESMRWKLGTGLEAFLLTAFQILIDLLPAFSLIVLWAIDVGAGAQMSLTYKMATVVLCAFRPNRPPVPGQTVQPFRTKSTTRSGVADQPL